MQLRTCGYRGWICRFVFCGLLAFCYDPAAAVDFQRDVAPIFQQHCVRCHDADHRGGQLSLATSADMHAMGYVIPGDPDNSHVLDVVRSVEGRTPSMPKEGEPLSADQVEVLRAWIAEGAPWPEGLVVQQTSKADGSWWSFQPLMTVEPPEVADLPADWADNPIDRFVYRRLAEQGLAPSPPADRRALIRRVTYGVTGLPPTAEEVRAFGADDSADAYERLVDRLLASPHYGQHWGRHWLDVVRFGESRGFERNEIVNNAWPYRDYIIRSLNEDKPFDVLVREHLAGDVIGRDQPEIEAGVMFLVCGPYDDVGNQDAAQAAQIRANTIDEIIRATGEAFLGLTIGCARCHDHKFDPLLQRDYYGWYATFAGVHHGDRTVATAQQRQARDQALRPLHQQRDAWNAKLAELQKQIDQAAGARGAEFQSQWVRPKIERTGTEERFEPIPARYVRLVVLGAESNPAARGGYGIDEFEIWTASDPPANVALASAGARAEGQNRVAGDFEDAYSAALTIDGKVGARWLASGPELTIELARVESIDRVLFSSDRQGDAGSHPVANFVSEYRIEVSLDGQQWTQVADSYDRQPINTAHRRHRLVQATITPEQRQQQAEWNRKLAELNRQINAVPALPVWWAGDFRPLNDPFHVFIGGDPQRPGQAVVPTSLEVLDPVVSPYRLDDQTPEGQRRQALADWIVHPENPLTPRVLANRIWHYHFGTGIVDTPSDFGYMGGQPTHPELLDWLAGQLQQHEGRWKPLHRMILLSQTYQQSSAYRAEAADRDADSRLLWRFPPRRLSAEEIRDTMLAVADRLDLQAAGPGFRLYRYLQDNVATYIPLDEHGPETYRRAVYHQNARSSVMDLLTEFDCPDNAFAAPRRASTTSPLQALTMLNHRFSLDMADFLAERLQREAGQQDMAAQVQRAFALVYGRSADATEQDASVAVIDRYGLRAFCRALLNSNELIYLP